MTMLGGSLCLLAACSGSIVADMAGVPAKLTASCAAPVALPQRDIRQAEVELAWGRDRAALRDCASRHALLADFLEGQRAAGR